MDKFRLYDLSQQPEIEIHATRIASSRKCYIGVGLVYWPSDRHLMTWYIIVGKVIY